VNTAALLVNSSCVSSTNVSNRSWYGTLVNEIVSSSFRSPYQSRFVFTREQEINDTRNDSHECRTFFTMIDTLDSNEYTLSSPQIITIRQIDDNNYVAHMISQDISASGETISEAIESLKDVVAMMVKVLYAYPRRNLGPAPMRQLRALNRVVREVGRP